MTLVLDIGNSTVSCALFHPVRHNILHAFKLSSQSPDVLSQPWTDQFHAQLAHHKVSFAIFSSVVPSLNNPIHQFLSSFIPSIQYFGPDSYHLLPISLVNPKEIGTDLIANAVYAWQKVHDNCAIIDFGTALSFTMINKDACLCAVAIAPGLGLALNSLISSAEQLESVPIKIPQTVLGVDTASAIQSGTILGYQHLIMGLVGQIKKELGCDTKFFLTGGFSSLFAPVFTEFTYEHNVNLTLEGINKIGQLMHQKSL